MLPVGVSSYMPMDGEHIQLELVTYSFTAPSCDGNTFRHNTKCFKSFCIIFVASMEVGYFKKMRFTLVAIVHGVLFSLKCKLQHFSISESFLNTLFIQFILHMVKIINKLLYSDSCFISS